MGTPEEKNLNVCFVGSARYASPLDATSRKKFQALSPLGALHIIGFSCSIIPRRFFEYADFYLMPQLPLAVLRYLTMFAMAPLLTLWCIFRKDVDVLVAQSPYEGVIAAFAKKIAGWFGHKVVLVVESHGDFEESYFLYRRRLVPGLYRFVMKAAARFSLHNADVLRAISHATHHQLQKWQSEKPIVRFITWTDIDVFFQEGQQGTRGDSKTFLYVGVVTPLKGITHLVNAFAALAADFQEIRLVIVGKQQNQAYVHELKAQIKELGIERQVQLISELPQKDLAQWMAQAYVFVLPSFSEGLGRVIVEAMATGTPVIGSHVGGIPELIQDGKTGFLVPPGDETGLAEKMRWMLQHPETVREMGRKAYLFACSFFSTDVYVQGYRKIFEAAQKLLKNNSECTMEVEHEVVDTNGENS